MPPSRKSGRLRIGDEWNAIALSVAPATREGVVPNEASAALIEALQRIEPVLTEFLRKREEAEADRASEAVQKDVQRAVVAALRDLPLGDYHLFDVGEAPQAKAAGGGGASTAAAENAPAQPELLAGPLSSVRLRPAKLRFPPSSIRTVSARAADADGREVVTGLDYAWELSDHAVARIDPDGRRATLTGLKDGPSTLTLTVRQGPAAVQAIADLLVTEGPPAEAPGADGSGLAGLPPYGLTAAAGEPWRSRFHGGRVQINSAHRDYAAARARAKSLRRYIGKLYAKEIVLLNFPDLPSGAAMERLVELVTRMEEKL